MAASLKQKTLSGLSWSFAETSSNQGLTFFIGIILARLLEPSEFGLIGMITIFIAVSTSLINSGFSQALIRKKNCTDTDYSTVFYFNLAVSFLLFIILFFLAQPISRFFEEPLLEKLVKVISLVIIIDAFAIIQRTILTKRIDFKLQTKVSVISNVSSGLIGIYLAYRGYGVWSLVAKQLSQQGFNSLLLWFWNRWLPTQKFSYNSFKELFSFGSKLLISGLIDTIYRNVYLLIIGKFFSAADLGYFTRAQQFSELPSQNINCVIQRVTYPVLSSIQDDIPRLKTSYQKLIRSTMFITFIVILGLAAVADPLVITLIGEKWRASVIYLQMLSLVGMMYPLHSLNLNMLNVLGRSDLFLKLEIIKKSLAVPTIIVGVLLGIKIMIVGMIVNTFIAYYLNSFWSGRFIGYSFKQQVKDILPSFSLALSIAAVVFFTGMLLPFGPIWNLMLQITAGAVYLVVFCEAIKFKDYIFVKELVLEKMQKIRNS